MADNGGAIIWNLDVDDAKFKAGLNSAEQKAAETASNVDKSFSGLGKSISNSLEAAKAGSMAFAGGLAAIGGGLAFAVKSAGEMEMLRSSLDTLTGSAEEGAKVFKDLNKFAAATPFETSDLAKATETMLSFGISSKDVLPNLKMIGDISLGNSEKLKGLSLVFGQVQSTGKLMGQDLLQMINQGFNPLTIIAQKTGRSMTDLKDDMSKGKISFDMVRDAMVTATSKGGLFFEGTEKGAKTLKGIWSTLNDTIGMTIKQAAGLSDTGEVIKGGLVDKVKIAITDLTNFLSANQGNITKFFSESLDWISKNGPTVVGIILGGLVPAIYGIVTAFIAMAAPLIPFIAAGALIGIAVKKIIDSLGGWEEAQKKVTDALKFLGDIFNTYIKPSLDELWANITTNLLPALSNLWTAISPILIPALKIIAAIIGTIVVVAINLFIFIINNAITAITKIADFITWLVERFKQGFTAIVGVVQSLQGWINTAVSWIQQLPGRASSALSDLGNQMKNSFINAFNAVQSEIQQWPNRLADWGRNIGRSFVDGVKNSLGGLKDAFTNGFNNARGAIEGRSPPKEGPLKDIDKWGFNIGNAWVQGMQSAIGQFSLPQIGGGSLGSMGTAPALSGEVASSGKGSGQQVTVNIGTVENQSDIDSLIHELGFRAMLAPEIAL